MGDHAQGRLANLPDLFGLTLVGEQMHIRGVGAPREGSRETPSLSFGVRPGLAPKLRQQPSAARRQQRQPLEQGSLPLAIFDVEIVNTLEPDRAVGHHLGHVIGALVDIRIGDHQQHALRGTFDQSAGGFEHGDAGAFRPDQRARHLEAVFRQQIIEVVSGNPPGNRRDTACARGGHSGRPAL